MMQGNAIIIMIGTQYMCFETQDLYSVIIIGKDSAMHPYTQVVIFFFSTQWAERKNKKLEELAVLTMQGEYSYLLAELLCFDRGPLH